MFTGLIEGGLRDTLMFGAITGAIVAILIAILSRFTTKRNAWFVIVGAGLVTALLLVLTQSQQITLSLGLQGAQIWVLALLYVLLVAWLGHSLRDVGGVG
jgi:Na+/melibiose symporter-like transporter